MKCLLLAAGYATRLYPLTHDRPKPLLPIAGRPLLDHVLDKVVEVPAVDEVIVVSNHRFVGHFRDWAARKAATPSIVVLDDGSTDNENRLGAVADLAFAIRELSLTTDLLVCAGDNLFDFSLADFASFFRKVGADCITTHIQENVEKLRRTGVIEVDGGGKVISFEEKPPRPKSNLAVPPCYLYKASSLSLITRFVEEGNDSDAPGNLIPWLITRVPVFAWRFEGGRYDVGDLESYHLVDRLWTAQGSGPVPY